MAEAQRKTAAAAGIQLEGLTKRFGPITAVEDLSLSIEPGEFVVLLGPSGSGKTTTLRLVAGLEKPDQGRVLIQGQDVTRISPAARNVTFVFQQYALYPHLSVYDNLAFPLRSPVRAQSEDAIQERVKTVAALLRIADKLENRATQLSGGQMQRVAIGRALVRDPVLHLMDEPLSSLDAKLRSDLRIELRHIQKDLGQTILYVTHDQIEAMTLATRIGVLDRGRLVQIGTPEQVYRQPATLAVAARLGSPPINLLPAGLLPDLPMPAGTTTIGARTEHLRLARADGVLEPGEVEGSLRWIEHLGDQNHLHIQLTQAEGQQPPQEIVALADPEQPLHPGDRLSLSLIDPLFFDAGGRRLTR